MRNKIKNRSALLRLLRGLKRRGKTVVFTNGCFDLLHVGHVRLLAAAKKLGDFLVVAVNSDRSIRALAKGPGRPLVPEGERAELIAALEMVDYVTIFGESTPLALIRALLPDVLVKGGDWKAEEIVGGKEVKAAGGKVVVVPLVPGHSTTELLSKCLRRPTGRNKITRISRIISNRNK
ncbi:MAG: D-glycero-beta-D-manno-heptose 1-phosphate adenylyltransferase [Candidatus Aureabacteria bacterium]|nr:D-glycero-beta-D-manno-heptose 1-phosphate adenylyltransferase [Candidatus Auribacterota bacterium]